MTTTIIGIDLEEDDPTVNDFGDVDIGAKDLLNTPALAWAADFDGVLRVGRQLDVATIGAFTVDLSLGGPYCQVVGPGASTGAFLGDFRAARGKLDAPLRRERGGLLANEQPGNPR